jgi:hypothetical protein
MSTFLNALVFLGEFLLAGVFGAFSIACIYVVVDVWHNDRDWPSRLGVVLFTCLFVGAAVALCAESLQHLNEVVNALLRS